MTWTLTPYTIAVFGSAIVALAVGIVALRQRPNPLAWPLAVLMFAVAAWAVPHAISFGYADVEWVAFWHRMRYPGTVTAPVAYLVIALRYAGYERWLTRRTYAALAAVPLVTVTAVWTNPYHGLFWRSIAVETLDGASVFAPAYGPLYWIDLAYLYGVTVLGLSALGLVVIRSGTVYRKQAILMFVGGVVPLGTNVAVNVVLEGTTIDPTTMALSVTGLTFALALFHLDLLEIRPIARDRLLEELDDGVVVVGPDERIRDYNSTAVRVLGEIEVDQPADRVLPSNVETDGGELVTEIDGRERMFRARSTPLTDDRGDEVGRIVYLNDVTELVEREQRISVLNRILRHNVRNELNVVSERLALLGERTAEDEHVETARASTRRVMEFAEKARLVERTLRESDTTMDVSAARISERVVAQCREDFPEATIEYEGPSGDALARVVDDNLFEMALTELVENGVVHNDGERPTVLVRVESGDDRVSVTVADDGPPISEAETESLDSARESHLDHSSGLGLWLVKWFTSLSGGGLSFGENDPRGNVVTIDLAADR